MLKHAGIPIAIASISALVALTWTKVFAQTECVLPLASVAVEGTWNDECTSDISAPRGSGKQFSSRSRVPILF